MSEIELSGEIVLRLWPSGLTKGDLVEYPFKSGRVWHVKWGGVVVGGFIAQSVCLTDQEV